MRKPRALGRHVEHDPRSRAFGLVRSPRELVSRVWKRTALPFNQQTQGPDGGELGSCTGNALIGVCVTEPFVHGRTTLGDNDAVTLYASGTRLDKIPGHYPPDDTGSSGLAVCKAAKKLGLIAGYRHAFGMHEALEALSYVGPVIAGFNWYEGFDRPVGMRSEIMIGGAVRGGHEVEILTIDVRARLVGCINSWGADWGSQGRFTISWDTLERLLAEDGDVTIPLAKMAA